MEDSPLCVCTLVVLFNLFFADLTTPAIYGSYSRSRWQLSIILLEGLRLMRPEKVWRPIITVEIDKHYAHEITLGVDGQSINRKDCFRFENVPLSSKVDIHVWHSPQTKKKKGRVLVARATHCLGELVKRTDADAEHKLRIRLQCRAADLKPQSAARGRPQKGATLIMRLQPPSRSALAVRSLEASTSTAVRQSIIHSHEDLHTLVGSDTEPLLSRLEKEQRAREDDEVSSAGVSTSIDASTEPPSTFDSPTQRHSLRQRRKKKVRGYAIDTDDEFSSGSTSCSSIASEDVFQVHDESLKIIITDDHDGSTTKWEELHEQQLVFRRNSCGEIVPFCVEGDEWIAASADHLLPRYTEKVILPGTTGKFSSSNTSVNTIKANGEPMIWSERILASLTMYGELCAASTEEQFEKVFRRLQYEWTFVGGLLVALAAVDTAVFSISSDSLFTVGGYARASIAVSSVASGLGIACDAWFLLRYNWADLNTFIFRAQDLFESYLFFSLSARMPAVCMFISSLSLMTFLGLVAFEVWPTGVLVICFCVGIVMTLQFLVYGMHWVGRRVVQGGKAGGVHVVTAVRKVRGMTVSPA